MDGLVRRDNLADTAVDYRQQLFAVSRCLAEILAAREPAHKRGRGLLALRANVAKRVVKPFVFNGGAKAFRVDRLQPVADVDIADV